MSSQQQGKFEVRNSSSWNSTRDESARRWLPPRSLARARHNARRGAMLSFLGRGKGGGESGGVESASDPSSAAPRPDTPASSLAGADALEISLQATLEGHTDRVWCVAWEPQGRSLATCSSDKTVRLWAPSRAAGGAWVTVAELEGVHNRTVRSVAWSPCGASAPRP